MSLQARLAGFFDVQPGEGRTTSLMLAHSFFMGLTTVFFETAASALFLSRYGPETLPYVYLAAAVLNTLTGLAYSALQSRLSFDRLMAGTLVFLLVVTLAFRTGLAVSRAGWLMFALLVFYRAVSILTDLEYWALAARLFDVRQAKRLFGFMGSGEVVARIGGAFSVPLLVGTVGVSNLLLASAAGSVGSLTLLALVLKAATPEAAREPEPGATGTTDRPEVGLKLLSRVLSNRYLMLIVALASFGVLGKYFVDFAFLGEMRSRYDDVKGLATFFGLFSGVSQALSLITRVFLSGRILGRYGIRAGLLVLPLAHLACTLLLVISVLLPTGVGFVFWLVIFNQGIYKTLKHPIDNPSFKVLYQPLKREQRLATQIAVETLVNPIMIGLAGAVMLFFSVVIPYRPTHFGWALLLTFGGWVAAALVAGREYAGALVRALRGRIEDIHFSVDDAQSLEILKQTLFRGEPVHVLVALELLESAAPPGLGATLLALLAHPSAEVREAVLLRLERLRPHGALDAVRQRLAGETSPRLRGAALRALAALGGSGVEAEVARFLEDPAAEVMTGAAVGLLRQRASVASHFLVDRSRSPEPAVRAWAARVTGEAGVADLHPTLAVLLDDPLPEVRRAALTAAGRLAEPALFPAMLGALRERTSCAAAAAAFVMSGERAVPFLGAAFHAEESAAVLARVARILGRIRGPATAPLGEQIGFPAEVVRQEVLEALWVSGYRAEGSEAATVESRLEAEARDAAWKLAVQKDLGEERALARLRAALEGELRLARRRIFLLLSFLYDPSAILRAADHLADASKEKRAYALEVLDVTLASELKPMLMPLLAEVQDRDARLGELFPEPPRRPEARLGEILSRGEEWTTPWTQACCLDAVSRLRALDLSSRVEALLRSGNPLVRETGSHTLSKLKAATATERPVSGGRSPMHTIERVITLKATPMFAETEEDLLADIAAVLEEVELPAGKVIFRKGEVGDSMYLIVEGRVRVFDGDRTIVHLGEGDIFGELALLDPELRYASIDSVTDTRLLRLDREAFLELMSANIEIVRGVLHVLCERLRRSISVQSAYGSPAAPLDTRAELS